MQQGMLDLCPRVPGDMAAADRDLHRPAGSKVNAQLTQPGTHPSGEPDGYASQQPLEVLPVESLVGPPETVEKEQVAGTWALAPSSSG
jgi:hypothetical protein